MEFIKLFIVGFAGYLLSGFHDVAMLYNKSSLKRILSLGFFITAIPYVYLFATYTSPHGKAIVLTTILLITLFGLLLIYSVFIETALFSSKAGTLYSEGTYRFSRHPGFIWYTKINVLVAFYFWNFHITLLCVGLIACNLILISIEDIILFPKLFPTYNDYRQNTPFIISLKNLYSGRKGR
jgi:protein-S-isoprenylcysteine O-methyltransferase Ste14